MIPKFRVFIKETITETDEMKDVILISFKSKLVRTNDERWYGFEDIILMQSTGLKDKNGVEIYEGDIVKLADDFAVVKFDSGAFVVDYQNLDTEFELIYSIEVPMEVIGNVWEDGELLEATK